MLTLNSQFAEIGKSEHTLDIHVHFATFVNNKPLM